jgi:hypothetical protein
MILNVLKKVKKFLLIYHKFKNDILSKFKTPSKASPRAGTRRGCLCENGTYSSKCCDGSLEAQGIGKTEGIADVVTTTVVSGTRTIVRQNG